MRSCGTPRAPGKVIMVRVLAAVGATVLAGCGGTLEGKYRRGERGPDQPLVTTTTTVSPGSESSSGGTKILTMGGNNPLLGPPVGNGS
jgi:hypothetical protein